MAGNTRAGAEAEAGPQHEGCCVLSRETELRKRRFLPRWSLDEAHDSPSFRSLWRAALSVPGGSVARAGLLLPSAGRGSTLLVLSFARWSQKWSPYFPVSRAPGRVMRQDIQVGCTLLLVKSRRAVGCRHSIPGMPYQAEPRLRWRSGFLCCGFPAPLLK